MSRDALGESVEELEVVGHLEVGILIGSVPQCRGRESNLILGLGNDLIKWMRRRRHVIILPAVPGG